MKPPSPEELRKIRISHETSDPNKSSLLPSSVKLEEHDKNLHQWETPPVRDLNSKENFYIKKDRSAEKEGNYSSPEVEHFVFLLSKGILHVADFLKIDGSYYSREMPLEKMEKSEEVEFEAERYILKYVFADWDKHYNNITKNVDSQFALHDFNKAFTVYGGLSTNAFDFGKSIPNLAGVKGVELRYLFTVDRKKVEIIINKKLDLFEDQFGDKEFFTAVVDKSGIDLDSVRFSLLEGQNREEKIESLRQYLLNRVKALKQHLE